MATIKAIEASSVHQIQSGQVIVDLCSVVKELVENGLDAGATSIEVRFKNQGLDSIEVQDNGSGISPDNYESVALKHYTSKLSTYSDLTTLETFGFRGEALSSLCALSLFTVTTCRQSEAPKGTKLEFETSGRLKGTNVVAAQKGTTVSVEHLFQNLPVRRRELERNIKREWGKVISLLNQYACIQTGVKFTVSQTPTKGKRIVLFSTKGNKTTRDNIVNVFGSKTISALVAMDLKLGLEATGGASQRWSAQDDAGTKEILVKGYVSRPNHGEGRQTPDRQMFYVNSRPCGLPQFAKVFNEVYKSFNSSQSPFIFADIQLDTHLYDVNVSPDKRTILLHDQTRMLDNLRDSLTELFEKQDYTMPISQIATFKQPAYQKLTIALQETAEEGSAGETLVKAPMPAQGVEDSSDALDDEGESSALDRMKNMAAAKSLAKDAQVTGLTARWAERRMDPREELKPEVKEVLSPTTERAALEQANNVATEDAAQKKTVMGDRSEFSDSAMLEGAEKPVPPVDAAQGEDDFLTRLAKLKRDFLPESLRNDMSDSEAPEEPIPAIAKPVKASDNAPLSNPSVRPPKRPSQEVATITIGDHTVTSLIGTPSKRLRPDESAAEQGRAQKPTNPSQQAAPLPSFNGRLTQMFASAARSQQDSAAFKTLQDEAESDQDPEDAMDDDSVASDMPSVDCEEEVEANDSKEQGAPSEKSLPMFVEQVEDTASVSHRQEQDYEGLDEEDGDYVDEEGEGSRENRKGQEVVKPAEEAGQEPSEETQKRTNDFMKGPGKGKYSTQSLLQRLTIDGDTLKRDFECHESQLQKTASIKAVDAADDFETDLEADNAEERLALTIHKGDFGKMKIVGQFNLGFVLAIRPGSGRSTASSFSTSSPPTTTQSQQHQDDELFIIDQHASDEKFNFERLQATTTVQSQRLVRPKPLDLTAVEEEIVIENQAALEKNGFVVAVDTSGDEPVGSRCQLLALPLSRETTFSLADLEELISLLGDNPTTTTTTTTTTSTSIIADSEGEDAVRSSSSHGGSGGGGGGYVPRPSKVRKMFAMRACRSSIMIGKALSRQQMERVVRHMGEMEKPWNCPHGRPTMRHLCGLGGAWDERAWREGDAAEERAVDFGFESGGTTDWAAYVRQRKQSE
ncbi:unnamed protein product [Discula destructiva]